MMSQTTIPHCVESRVRSRWSSEACRTWWKVLVLARPTWPVSSLWGTGLKSSLILFYFPFYNLVLREKKSININLPTKISYHQSVQENIKSKLFLHLLLRIYSKVYFPYCADWSWQLCSSHLTVIIFSSRALLYLWYSQKQSVNVLGERDSIYREASRHYNTLSM